MISSFLCLLAAFVVLSSPFFALPSSFLFYFFLPFHFLYFRFLPLCFLLSFLFSVSLIFLFYIYICIFALIIISFFVLRLRFYFHVVTVKRLACQVLVLYGQVNLDTAFFLSVFTDFATPFCFCILCTYFFVHFVTLFFFSF